MRNLFLLNVFGIWLFLKGRYWKTRSSCTALFSSESFSQYLLQHDSGTCATSVQATNIDHIDERVTFKHRTSYQDLVAASPHMLATLGGALDHVLPAARYLQHGAQGSTLSPLLHFLDNSERYNLDNTKASFLSPTMCLWTALSRLSWPGTACCRFQCYQLMWCRRWSCSTWPWYLRRPLSYWSPLPLVRLDRHNYCARSRKSGSQQLPSTAKQRNQRFYAVRKRRTSSCSAVSFNPDGDCASSVGDLWSMCWPTYDQHGATHRGRSVAGLFLKPTPQELETDWLFIPIHMCIWLFILNLHVSIRIVPCRVPCLPVHGYSCMILVAMDKFIYSHLLRPYRSCVFPLFTTTLLRTNYCI